MKKRLLLVFLVIILLTIGFVFTGGGCHNRGGGFCGVIESEDCAQYVGCPSLSKDDCINEGCCQWILDVADTDGVCAALGYPHAARCSSKDINDYCRKDFYQRSDNCENQEVYGEYCCRWYYSGFGICMGVTPADDANCRGKIQIECGQDPICKWM